MRTTDISNYKENKKDKGKGIPAPVKTALSYVVKILLTTLLVVFIAGVVVGFNVIIYLFNLASEPSGIDLDARSLNLSSFVYVQDPDTGEFVEYQTLYGTENREWVDYDDIPQAMFDAIISIEDKRFESHNGVDWRRTGSAVLNLITQGDDSYGGSTITQQLIKNFTKDDEASINRKVREIVKALKVEQEYTKDEIIEAYLNIVNFGGNCQGVQAAANRYFDKDISECSIAECAAIAGITQNPSKWDPLIYPENNKIRREIIINEMYAQEKITKEEYDAAMAESATMTFSTKKQEVEEPLYVGDIQNWYQDELVFDLAADLAEYYNISEEAAIDKLYTEGYNIYSAMDINAQKIIEEEALNIDKSSDPDLEIGMSLIGLDGRVIATVGSSNKKEGNLVFDRATMSTLQPGSSIKPVVAYPYAVDKKLLNYSATVPDEPLESWVYSDGTHGPTNWYGYYTNGLFLVDAIEWSSNACAAQALEMIGGPTVAYNHATTYLGFKNLNPDVDPYAYAGFSLGGMNGGVTVREMANAYTYVANGGLHYEPYTYYYITDQRGNVILDNRNNIPLQAYSKETATIMNRMLHYNVTNCKNTHAWRADIYGWEICGKTGTTNDDKDSWFCGTSPYAALAVWTGYDDPQRIADTSVATNTFNAVMSRYLEDKENIDYTLSDQVVEKEYCSYTGKIAIDTCKKTFTGYYTEDNMPGKCSDHGSLTDPLKKDETTEATEETQEITTTESDFFIDIPAVNTPEEETTTDPAEPVTDDLLANSPTETESAVAE